MSDQVELSSLNPPLRTITCAEAGLNFAAELDLVIHNGVVTIITNEHGGAGVLLSLREYESLRETLHLVRNPKNAIRLMQAIDNIETRQNLVRHELIEP